MDEGRFKIVFQKLKEAAQEQERREPNDEQTLRVNLAEVQEISELRRLVIELTEPEPKYFTGT